MGASAKRYPALIILFDLWKLVKNAALPGFFFLIQYDSDSIFMKIGRYGFVVFFIGTVLFIFMKWLNNKYELDDHSFYIYKGVFQKSEQTIPFSKIQNVSRHTSLFHKLFNLTSIRFETSMSGEDAAVVFEVLTKGEAERIEAHVANQPSEESAAVALAPDIAVGAASTIPFDKKIPANRTVHFSPTNRDLIKASFTSLSFLIFISVIGSLYAKIDDMFNVDKQAKGVLDRLIDSWWVLLIVVIIIIIVSVAFGIARTFLKYGNYEISSDQQRIFIQKGILEETAFSIPKERVQAIEIVQSPIKRILGLAEVKLTSSGDIIENENSQNINSLYPFLPVKRAYEMISEILPTYKVTEEMDRLPKKSFLVRVFRPSWIWLIATVILVWTRPELERIEGVWWIGPVLWLLILVALRILDYRNTRYVLNEHFIQIKKGGLSTNLFISKRDKIIEVEVSRSLFQKWFGLASIGTINRAKPVHHAGIDDIPKEIAAQFYTWYIGRRNEIELK